jgi:hypothetical protein
MADARIAAAVRQRVQEQSGSETLAKRMVPLAANEARYAETAAQLEAALAPNGTNLPFPAPQRMLTGLPDPRTIQTYIQEVVARLDALLPRVQSLAGHPVVQQMVVDLTVQVLQRCAARSVKFVFSGAGVATRSIDS